MTENPLLFMTVHVSSNAKSISSFFDISSKREAVVTTANITENDTKIFQYSRD